ncbi:multicopper oxidase domain-containing protein [Streptomyces sp. NPDC005969]|uniref:multicopper oxidase domain-containing protein n=1 Tax=Streptomyces sp. NPDC005969 TaxID=3156722 RepID=UPI0033F26B4C
MSVVMAEKRRRFTAEFREGPVAGHEPGQVQPPDELHDLPAQVLGRKPLPEILRDRQDHFQLMSTNGKAEDPTHSVYDTVNVPRRGAVVIRVHFTKFTGRTVLHCHILNHEDMGMMAVLDIVPSPTGHQKTPGK